MTDEDDRAVLRERYLRVLGSLGGREAKIEMFEKTKVSGTIVGVKADSSHVIVSDLATPIGVHASAVLRTSDVISLSVPFSEKP